MKWNYDFELAALAFEIILIVFYFAKRHLPTKKNRYFILCMCVGCCMTFMDVVTAFTNVYWQVLPYEILQLLNVIYFISTSLNTLFLFMFILAITDQLDMTRSPLFSIYCIPAAVAIIIALATPFTGAIYYFDSVLGYMHGPTYFANYVLNSFYLLLATVYIIVYRKSVQRMQFLSVIFMIFLLAMGVVLQGLFFNWVLLTNAFLCLSMSVMYLSSQNPDLYIDKDTNLFNRDGFNEYLDELTSNNTRYTCLVICLDNYRTLKSVFGEDKARAALTEVLGYVKTRYTDDHLFRYNEDTYIVLTPVDFETEPAMAQGRMTLDGGFNIDGEQIRLTVRFIVVPYDMVGSDAELVMDVIKFALKKVALGGRGDIIVDEEFVRKSRRSRDVESAMGMAIERNAVQIYFMPMFSPFTERMERAEALARIFDENVGFIPPSEFIAEAERNGSIIALGRQIFEKTCEFIKDQEPYRYGVERISVNLSAKQLMQEGMADEFMDIADRNGVSMERFSFDIAEISDRDSTGMVQKNMDRLISRGAEFALNDYGSGYSSLENIMKLPIDLVKIDRTLVRSYFESGSMLLPDVIEMFRNQKLKIALVGVETKDMARRLSVMGCDYLEGYFYSRTIPARNFVAMMKKQGMIDGGVHKLSG